MKFIACLLLLFVELSVAQTYPFFEHPFDLLLPSQKTGNIKIKGNVQKTPSSYNLQGYTGYWIQGKESSIKLNLFPSTTLKSMENNGIYFLSSKVEDELFFLFYRRFAVKSGQELVPHSGLWFCSMLPNKSSFRCVEDIRTSNKVLSKENPTEKTFILNLTQQILSEVSKIANRSSP